MKTLFFPFIALFLLSVSCSTEDATEIERTNAAFLDSLGGNVSAQQMWRTAVRLNINVKTDEPIKMWLLVSQNSQTLLCDYKEVKASGKVVMTAPQGQGEALTLKYLYKNKVSSQSITLSGKREETISLNTASASNARVTRSATYPESLCGSSISGNAEYYQFTSGQLEDYFKMMDLSMNNKDAKQQGLNCNYELESNGPFYITWVNGYEAEQR